VRRARRIDAVAFVPDLELDRLLGLRSVDDDVGNSVDVRVPWIGRILDTTEVWVQAYRPSDVRDEGRRARIDRGVRDVEIPPVVGREERQGRGQRTALRRLRVGEVSAALRHERKHSGEDGDSCRSVAARDSVH
jgi:hypothetical protein